jgi:histidine triad (HIT) family protein
VSCVFCRIRDGDIPSVRVYEDDRVFAIMDINPVNEGHVLVIPRRHGADIFETEADDLAAVMRAAKAIASAQRSALRPDGLNLVQSNGAAASQTVFHFHLHLIPRWSGDGKQFHWKLAPGDPARIQAVGAKIRAAVV